MNAGLRVRKVCKVYKVKLYFLYNARLYKLYKPYGPYKLLYSCLETVLYHRVDSTGIPVIFVEVGAASENVFNGTGAEF